MSDAYREYVIAWNGDAGSQSSPGTTLDESRFSDVLSRFYVRHHDLQFERKADYLGSSRTDPALTADADRVRLCASEEQSFNVLVARNIFKQSAEWTIRFDYELAWPTGMSLPDRIGDIGEPFFFTFSDERDGGYVVFWPDSIEYWDLADSSRHKVTRAGSLAGRRSLVVRKTPSRFLVQIDDASLDVDLEAWPGREISDGNYEIPPFLRYSRLNPIASLAPNERAASLVIPSTPGLDSSETGFGKLLFERTRTRNFIRFGALFYPFLKGHAICMSLYDVKVQ